MAADRNAQTEDFFDALEGYGVDAPDELAQQGEVGHNLVVPEHVASGETFSAIQGGLGPIFGKDAVDDLIKNLPGVQDLVENYGKPMDQFLGEQYPGLEHLLPSIQESPGKAGAVRMSEIADSLEATQHQGVDALSNVAKGIDPAALSDPLRAREADFRNEVAARAAGFDELARLAGSAPSVENARTGALLSQHAGQLRAALAGGRGLLGQRAALGQGATSGTALAADAAVRQGKEGVARLGEVAQNRLAGLNVYGQGHGISTGMLGTAGGLERDAFGARTDIFDAAADFGRGVASTRADLYGAAGDNVLDDQLRQGTRAAQIGRSIYTDEASEDRYQDQLRDMKKTEEDYIRDAAGNVLKLVSLGLIDLGED